MSLPEFERDARWLGNAAVTLSARKSDKLPQRWAEMQERLDDAIAASKPDLIVLEYPADGMPKWSGGTARGIDFHMGMFFGFAALAAADYDGTCTKRVPIALMPVTSSKAAGRVGWMPRVTTQKGRRRVTHTQDRETTLRQCRQIAHAIAYNAVGEMRRATGRQVGVTMASEEVDALSEHELMALGVLTYYVTNRSPSQWGE